MYTFYYDKYSSIYLLVKKVNELYTYIEIPTISILTAQE